MSSSAEQRLSQHYDGELPAEEAEDFAARLAEDEDLRAKLDGLAHLTALLKEGHRALEDDLELDGEALFDAITAKLGEDLAEDVEDDDPMFPEPVLEDEAADEAEGEAEAALASRHERPALRVVKGGGAKTGAAKTGAAKTGAAKTGAAKTGAAKTGAAKTGAERKPAERTERPAATNVTPIRRRDPEEDRRTGVTMLFGALAAAAAVLFMVMRDPPAAETPDARPGGDPVVAEAPHPPAGSEVEEVDFGVNTGAIFSVEGQEGEQYAVVWISDEKVELEEEEERL